MTTLLTSVGRVVEHHLVWHGADTERWFVLEVDGARLHCPARDGELPQLGTEFVGTFAERENI